MVKNIFLNLFFGEKSQLFVKMNLKSSKICRIHYYKSYIHDGAADLWIDCVFAFVSFFRKLSTNIDKPKKMCNLSTLFLNINILNAIIFKTLKKWLVCLCNFSLVFLPPPPHTHTPFLEPELPTSTHFAWLIRIYNINTLVRFHCKIGSKNTHSWKNPPKYVLQRLPGNTLLIIC